MTDYLSKTIGLKHWKDLRTMAEKIPKPVDWFHGHIGRIPVLPREVLSFFRGHQLDTAPSASHPRFVLIICMEGAGGVIVDGVIHHLQTGSCILVFPYQTHGYTRFASNRPAWLFLTFEMERVPALDFLRGAVLPLQDTHIASLLCVLQCLMKRQQKTSDAPIHLLFFLNRLLDAAQDIGSAIPLDQPDRLVANRLKQIVELVQQHLEAQLTVGTVARACNLSASRLRAFFKKHVGFSLGKYIRHARIHAACEAMRHEGLNITETADRFRFSSTYAFSRTFKQVMGIPPSEYRERHAQKRLPPNNKRGPADRIKETPNPRRKTELPTYAAKSSNVT